MFAYDILYQIQYSQVPKATGPFPQGHSSMATLSLEFAGMVATILGDTWHHMIFTDAMATRS